MKATLATLGTVMCVARGKSCTVCKTGMYTAWYLKNFHIPLFHCSITSDKLQRHTNISDGKVLTQL